MYNKNIFSTASESISKLHKKINNLKLNTSIGNTKKDIQSSIPKFQQKAYKNSDKMSLRKGNHQRTSKASSIRDSTIDDVSQIEHYGKQTSISKLNNVEMPALSEAHSFHIMNDGYIKDDNTPDLIDIPKGDINDDIYFHEKKSISSGNLYDQYFNRQRRK